MLASEFDIADTSFLAAMQHDATWRGWALRQTYKNGGGDFRRKGLFAGGGGGGLCNVHMQIYTCRIYINAIYSIRL